MKADLLPLKPFIDSRGILKKILLHSQVEEGIGEVYVLYTKPGSTRGNHYHKLTVEFFAVISGTASIALKDMRTGDLELLELSAWDNRVLKVPPWVAHALRNDTDEALVVLAMANREYSPEDPDTYKAEIIT